MAKGVNRIFPDRAADETHQLNTTNKTFLIEPRCTEVTPVGEPFSCASIWLNKGSIGAGQVVQILSCVRWPGYHLRLGIVLRKPIATCRSIAQVGQRSQSENGTDYFRVRKPIMTERVVAVSDTVSFRGVLRRLLTIAGHLRLKGGEGA
ncbi:unnamed protein product [Soboliphyme baturini]|uniref:HlyD family secretion protein n=1 Tax=Soboliphyme baturini TaxID=241478 RepID=A0A183IIW5_9BILA|nr:unnamed protein product [Soboliphyme baturini]